MLHFQTSAYPVNCNQCSGSGIAGREGILFWEGKAIEQKQLSRSGGGILVRKKFFGKNGR